MAEEYLKPFYTKIGTSQHAQALFKDLKEDKIYKIAKTDEEAKELLELGFIFSNQIGQSYLYWKRK